MKTTLMITAIVLSFFFFTTNANADYSETYAYCSDTGETIEDMCGTVDSDITIQIIFTSLSRGQYTFYPKDGHGIMGHWRLQKKQYVLYPEFYMFGYGKNLTLDKTATGFSRIQNGRYLVDDINNPVSVWMRAR